MNFFHTIGHADVVALLLNNDADLNHQDKRGNTPLIIAVQRGNNHNLISIC